MRLGRWWEGLMPKSTEVGLLTGRKLRLRWSLLFYHIPYNPYLFYFLLFPTWTVCLISFYYGPGSNSLLRFYLTLLLPHIPFLVPPLCLSLHVSFPFPWLAFPLLSAYIYLLGAILSLHPLWKVTGRFQFKYISLPWDFFLLYMKFTTFFKKLICLFIFGCVGSSLLHVGFL